MNNSLPFRLSAALTIPFKENLQIDEPALISHANALLKRGCDCVTLGGTTGEGPSLSLSEKLNLLDKMIKAGMTVQQIGLAAFGNDLQDSVYGLRQCLSYNINHVLIAQPFYFKNPSAQGITDWYDYVFSSLGDNLRNVILYNIPSCTAIDLPHETIDFLCKKYGTAIIGLKESSGDKNKTLAYQKAFPNLALYVGSEAYLGEMVAMGAMGAISGCANFIPEAICDIIKRKKDSEAVSTLVSHIVRYPVTPAIKFFVARQYENAQWLRTRPPLTALDEKAQSLLAKIYDDLQF